MFKILQYLRSGDINNDNWYYNRFVPYYKEKYNAIIPLFLNLTKDPLSQHNLLSKQAIEDNVKNESIFSFDNFVKYNQSINSWKPILNSDGTINTELRKRTTHKPNIGSLNQYSTKNCSEQWDPDKKESCCQRVTKNIYKLLGYKTKTEGGKTKNKNKNKNKNKTKNKNIKHYMKTGKHKRSSKYKKYKKN